MSNRKLSNQAIPKRRETLKKANNKFEAADADPGLSDSPTVTTEKQATQTKSGNQNGTKQVEYTESGRPKIARRDTQRASFSLYKSDVETLYKIRLSLMQAGRERYRSDIVRLALAALDDLDESELWALDDRLQGEAPD